MDRKTALIVKNTIIENATMSSKDLYLKNYV